MDVRYFNLRVGDCEVKSTHRLLQIVEWIISPGPKYRDETSLHILDFLVPPETLGPKARGNKKVKAVIRMQPKSFAGYSARS